MAKPYLSNPQFRLLHQRTAASGVQSQNFLVRIQRPFRLSESQQQLTTQQMRPVDHRLRN